MTSYSIDKKFFFEPVHGNSKIFQQYRKVQFDPEYLTACALAQKGEALILTFYSQENFLDSTFVF